MKAHIALLYASPNTPSFTLHYLFLHIDIKSDLLFSQRSVNWQLLAVTKIKSKTHGLSAWRITILKPRKFFHVCKICFYTVLFSYKRVPCLNLSEKKKADFDEALFSHFTKPTILKLLCMVKLDLSILHFALYFFFLLEHTRFYQWFYAWCPRNLLSTVGTMCIP